VFTFLKNFHIIDCLKWSQSTASIHWSWRLHNWTVLSGFSIFWP